MGMVLGIVQRTLGFSAGLAGASPRSPSKSTQRSDLSSIAENYRAPSRDAFKAASVAARQLLRGGSGALEAHWTLKSSNSVDGHPAPRATSVGPYIAGLPNGAKTRQDQNGRSNDHSGQDLATAHG